MKKRVFVLVILILSMTVSSFAADLKVGVVEVEHIMKNSRELLNKKGKLREKFNKLQGELNEREKALKKSIEDFQAQSSLYSAEAKKEKETELKKEEENLVNTFKKYQGDIKENEQEMVKSVVEQVREIAKEKGYTLVIEKNSGFVIYAADELDINKDIIDTIDSAKKE
jgi:outer membrane protein